MGQHFNDLAAIDTNFAFTYLCRDRYVLHGSTGGLVKTSNGGINWLSDPLIRFSYEFGYFTNSDLGWVCAYFCIPIYLQSEITFIKQTNKGVNWTRVFRGFD